MSLNRSTSAFHHLGKGYKACELTVRGDGSYPLRRKGALIGLLTNTAYLGWYTYGGMVVSKEAHAPIVELDDFLYAFERLSSTNLDGTEKQERKPREQHYGGASALLDGVVQYGELPVYALEGKYKARNENKGFQQTVLAVNVEVIDKAFSQAMIAVLATLELKRADSDLTKRIRALQAEQVEQVGELDEALTRLSPRDQER